MKIWKLDFRYSLTCKENSSFLSSHASTQTRISKADDFVRCDKNGDGMLSEEEVTEVSTETPLHVLYHLFSMFVNQISKISYGKGYSFECLREQAGEI